MSSAEQLKRGMVIRHEGQLYTVVDHSLAQSGKQKPTIHVKLRHVKSGRPVDRTLDQLGKIDEVQAEVRQMQYLYAAGEERVFMDSESFEQYSLVKDLLQGALDYLVEEQTYKFLMVDGQAIGIQLPEVIVIEVADTAPVEHAGGHSTVQKEATLASGLLIHVPLFIKNGDKIRLNTATRQYLGKEHA